MDYVAIEEAYLLQLIVSNHQGQLILFTGGGEGGD